MKLRLMINIVLLSLYGSQGIFAADTPYTGLPNVGNSCWLNAASQFLRHAFNNMPVPTDNFYKRIFYYEDQEDLDKTVQYDFEKTAQHNYQYHYRLFLQWRAGYMPIKECAYLLSTYNPRAFVKGVQNDAGDYVNNVFEGFLARVKYLAQCKQQGTDSEDDKAGAQSIEQHYHISEHSEKICCFDVENPHKAAEPMIFNNPYIELELVYKGGHDPSKENFVDDKMNGVTQSLSIVELTEDFNCRSCAWKVSIKKIRRFDSLPETVYMRTQVFRRDKVGNQFKFAWYKVPSKLDFTNYATEQLKSTGQQLKYDLIGFTTHRGSSLNGGHWIAVLKHGDEWVKYDDSRVTDEDSDSVVEQLASGQFQGFTPVNLLYRRIHAGDLPRTKAAPLARVPSSPKCQRNTTSSLSLIGKITKSLQGPSGCVASGILGLGALYYAYQRPTSAYAQAAKYLGALGVASSVYFGRQHFNYYTSCM